MPIPQEKIPEWRSGEELLEAVSARRLNAPLRRINEVADWASRLPPDTAEPGVLLERWVGEVVTTGPSGEVAPAPPQYWVKRKKPDPAAANGGVLTWIDENVPGAKKTVKATDALGVGAGAGDRVLVFVELVLRDKPAYHYYFIQPAGVGLVRITGNATGGGQYSGTFYSGDTTADGLGSLEMPEGLAAGQSVLVMNGDEDGQATHWITTNTHAVGFRTGMSNEASPRPAVIISRGQYRTASPQTFGSAAERTTAATDTWNRANTTSGSNYGDVPAELWLCTGVSYDHAAGTPELKAHMRKLTIAADGRNHSFGAETLYVIDTPEACDAASGGGSDPSVGSWMGI